MSNLGVFQWIRDAVRRSVLLGFSDAVEQLGGAAEASEPLNPQFAAALRQAAAPALAQSAPPVGSTTLKRKRLGRSLEPLRDAPPRMADGAS